jgi:phage FluMu protein Com
MDDRPKDMKYEKLLIDNATCNRRFHLVFETGAKNNGQVEIKCPHCGVILFHEENHPPVMLARDENLIKSPDGSEPIIYDCKFNP